MSTDATRKRVRAVEDEEAPFDAVTDQEMELKNKVADFRKEMQHQARQLIHETMPTKMMQLNQMFEALPRTLPDTYNPLVVSLDESIKLDQNQPNMVPSVTLPNGKISYPQHVNSSKEIRQLGEQLKAEALQLIEISNKVKISIQLNIPKIESGGDFGVQIQEETVAELSRAEDNAFSILDTFNKYHLVRAKLVTKVIKYPNVEDYQRSIYTLDYKEYLNYRMITADLRNAYAIMYDLITKNLDRLKKPRNSHVSTMF